MGLSSAWGRIVVVGGFALTALACSAAPSKKASGGGEDPYSGGYGDPGGELPPPRNPDFVDEDGGAFDLGGRPSDGTSSSDGGRPSEDPPSGVDGGKSDAGSSPTLCSGPLKAGDLKIVELMIASQAGSGDKGEWIEIQSTRSCTLQVQGVKVTSPRGNASDVAEIATSTLIPPYGTFVVANTTNTALNKGLPGKVFAFAGEPADVLKNDGDTVEVWAGTTPIDTLTYPKFTIMTGRSVSFPWDCTWNERSDWQRWSWSFDTYGSAGMKGTPNADNFDVACY
jgi:hypothetical protein